MEVKVEVKMEVKRYAQDIWSWSDKISLKKE